MTRMTFCLDCSVTGSEEHYRPISGKEYNAIEDLGLEWCSVWVIQ